MNAHHITSHINVIIHKNQNNFAKSTLLSFFLVAFFSICIVLINNFVHEFVGTTLDIIL
jgi:hypothetical protein